MWKATNTVRNEKAVINNIWRGKWSDNHSDRDFGRPLQEVDADTYRRMWETDPQWQGYKRLYDAVYGDSPAGNDVEK